MDPRDNSPTYHWPGLAPYQEKDKDLFYGRAVEISDLFRNITSSRLTVLFGPSGSGKTSLLQAGVFPRLLEKKILPVIVRLEYPAPGTTFIPLITQIGHSLRRSVQQDISIISVLNNWFSERESQLTLWEWLRSFTLVDSTGEAWLPVFVFDQFEEVFTLGKHAKGLESFLKQIGDAAENFLPREIKILINEEGELPFDHSIQPYKILITLRDDYFAQLQSLGNILPGVTVRQNHFSLGRLTGREALKAIIGPAPAGLISKEVASEIVHFVANASEQKKAGNIREGMAPDQYEVEPAILSLVCQRLDLKRTAQGQETITVDFVEQSKSKILEDFYEEAMNPVQPDTRNFIENRLLDADGFRTSEPESNLARDHINIEDIQQLISLRLIHRIELYQHPHLELSHDVLAPTVKASRDTRLQREKSEKSAAEIVLLKKQRRRSLILAAGFGFITLIALAAGFFGLQKKREAEMERMKAGQERSKALSMVFVNQSQEYAGQNIDYSLGFSQLAFQLDSSLSSTFNLSGFLYNSLKPPSQVLIKDDSIGYKRIAVCSDGKHLLTISYIGVATIWDWNKKRLSSLGKVGDTVLSAEFSPDGTRVVTFDKGGNAKYCDVNGNLIINSSTGMHHQPEIKFSRNGERVFIGSISDTVAILWDLLKNRIVPILTFPDLVSSVDFSPDGERLLMAFIDKPMEIRNVNGNVLREFKGAAAIVNSAVFSPDGYHVLTTSNDSIATIWDLKGRVLVNFTGHKGELNDALYSPDGNLVLTSSSDGTARLWDPQGHLFAHYSGHKGSVQRAGFSQNGKKIVTVSNDGTAKVWDLKGNLLADLIGHKEIEEPAVFSPDGLKVATISTNGTAKIWDLSGNMLADWEVNDGKVHLTRLSPDGLLLLTACNGIQLWDLKGNPIARFPGNSKEPDEVCFSPDAQRILIINRNNNTAQLWDYKEARIIELKGHNKTPKAVFSPDEERILTYDRDSTAKLWDFEGNLLDKFMLEKTMVVTDASFTKDGVRLLINTFDTTSMQIPIGNKIYYESYLPIAKLLDLKGKTISELRNVQTESMALLAQPGFTADGNRIIASSTYSTTRIWNLMGEQLAELKGEYLIKASSADCKRFLIVRNGNSYKSYIWNITEDRIIELQDKSEDFILAAFSNNGMSLLTVSYDNSVRLWNANGIHTADIKGFNSRLISATFLSDGERILTVTADGTVKIWPGYKEAVNQLSGNSDKEKISIIDMLKIPIELSEAEFGKAVLNNIIEGKYPDYMKGFKKLDKSK